jgi:geranylgeranyl diphosphate synthase type II
MTLKTYMKEQKTLIDNRLAELLQPEVKAFETLYKSMNYSLIGGGKRIRPILMLAVLDMLGKDGAPYLDIACALECVHTYSLIHDDLPAMDNDDYRRGNLTNHKVYGDGMAILAGDALLTYAFELIAGQSQVEPAKIAAIIKTFAHAAGPAGMVGGQAYDLESEGNRDIGIEGLKLLHNAKTGVIFKAAIDIAAILGDATPAQRQALDAYATAMGLTFQITDDILDVIGDSKVLGKPVGSDEKNNKATYVTIFSLPEAQKLAQQAAAEAVAALEIFADRGAILKELVNYMLIRVN